MTSLDSRTSGRANDRRTAPLPGGPAWCGLAVEGGVEGAPQVRQMLISALVVIAAVIAGGWLYVNKGGVEEVLVVAQPIPAGHPITEDDVRTSKDPLLVSRSVSGIDGGAIPVSEVDSVFGQRTTVALLPGQVLTEDSLTSDLLPQAGKRLIAVNLPAGRVPDTLAPGSVVDAIAVPQEGQSGDPKMLDDPTVISAGATVYSSKKSQDGTVVVTILISETDAKTVAAYGGRGGS